MNGKRNLPWRRLVGMSLFVAATFMQHQLHAQDAASQSQLKLVIDDKHAVKVYDMHGKLIDGFAAKRVENKNPFRDQTLVAHSLADLQNTPTKQLEESKQQLEPQIFAPLLAPATPVATLQPESATAQYVNSLNPSGAFFASNLVLYSGSGSDNTYFYDGNTHELEVNTSVANFGTTSVGSFRVGFYLSTDTNINSSDYLIATATQGGLNANFYVNLSRTVDLDNVSNLPSGAYYVIVFIDDQGQVPETNENDNATYYTPTINYTRGTSGSPNLALYTGSGANNTYNYDGNTHVLAINTSVGNLGTANAGSFRVGFYLSTDTNINSSDYLIANVTQNGLNANAFVTLSRTVDLDDVSSLPSGTYYIIIFMDDQGQVTESNENDNGIYYTPTINYMKSSSGSPNLALYTGSGANNTYNYDGNTHVLAINTSVGNLGTANAGSFRVGFYLSTDTNINASDYLIANATQNGLTANAFVTLSRTVDLDDISSLPAGTYYIIIVMDDQAQVTESNESDNIIYYTPTINYTKGGGGAVLAVAPDFREVPATGGNTTFSVSNTGTGTMNWSAVANAAWLTITAGASGTNSGTITVTYAANSSNQRTGTITITASGAAGSPKTVEVRQAAVASGPPTIRIVPASLTIQQP